MSEDAAIVELVPDVELAPLVSRVTPYSELDAQEFEQAATESDAAKEAGDCAGALTGAQALLTGLVRNVARELRRPPGESLQAFRVRPRKTSCVRRNSRFLEQKGFLNAFEAQAVQRAAMTTEMPTPECGVSPAAWSRLGRQMVYGVVDHLLTRYAAWRAGCSCEADESVEMVVFQPLGGGPAYERAVCRRCRCPRQTPPATESPEAAASMLATEGPVVTVKLLVATGPGVEVTPAAVPASVG